MAQEFGDSFLGVDWDGIGFSPKTFEELKSLQFEDEGIYKHNQLLLKMPFGLSLISQITTWKDSKGVIHRSPFTPRTQLAFFNIIRAITDQAVLLSNLQNNGDKIALKEFELVLNVHYLQFDRIDIKKPQFYPILKLISQYTKFIISRAVGDVDRERLIQRGPRMEIGKTERQMPFEIQPQKRSLIPGWGR